MTTPESPAPPPHEGAWRRFLFEQARDAVYMLDEQGRVLVASASLAALLGRAPADALRQRVWDQPASAI